MCVCVFTGRPACASLCLMRGFHDDDSGGNPRGIIYIFKCNSVVELQPEIEWLNQ